MARSIYFVLFGLLVFFLIFPAAVSAGIRTIESTSRQPFSGSLSSDDASVIATVKAKRSALIIAGDYIEGLPVVNQAGISRDEFPVLAAGVMKSSIVPQKSFVTEDGSAFEAMVRVSVDPDTLETDVAKLLNDSARIKQYQEIRKQETELLSTFNNLIKKNRDAETAAEEEKAALKNAIQNTTRMLLAVVWYNNALDLSGQQPLSDETANKIIGCLATTVKLNPEYGPAYVWLGRLYSNKKRYDRAVVYYQKALDIDRQSPDKNDPDIAAAYNRLGLALHRDGEYDQAIEAYMSAWKIQIQALGESHPDVATTYNNLGEAYREKGDFDRAIEYYTKDLNICLDTLGQNHLNVATSYNNLAYAYHGKGDKDRAIEYFKKALKVYRIALGDDHPQTKTIQENIDYLENKRW